MQAVYEPSRLHALVVTERRLIAAWGRRLRSSSELVISGSCRHAECHSLGSLKDPRQMQRARSGSQEWVLWFLQLMPVMCGERAELVHWRAMENPYLMRGGHLIWQLREPWGLRRRRDWAWTLCG